MTVIKYCAYRHTGWQRKLQMICCTHDSNFKCLVFVMQYYMPCLFEMIARKIVGLNFHFDPPTSTIFRSVADRIHACTQLHVVLIWSVTLSLIVHAGRLRLCVFTVYSVPIKSIMKTAHSLIDSWQETQVVSQDLVCATLRVVFSVSTIFRHTRCRRPADALPSPI
jgi:hypothetical protein